MSSEGLYVPPHLRGRSATSSAPAGSSAPGSGNDIGNGNDVGNGSRPKNAKGNERKDGKSSGGRRNSNSNSNSNRSRRNGKATAASASGGGSRWANVDRSSIEAGGHRRTNNNNNSNKNNMNNGSSHQQQTSSNRNHNHRNNRNKHVRAIFFGDSFVKLFGLLNDYSDSVLKTPRKIQVHKYKAASAKGLCREGNKNRADIERVLHKLCKGAGGGGGPQAPLPYPNLERLVFCFGSVDVHMSYYFKKYVREEPLSEDDLREIARNFVDFVAGLEVPSAGKGASQRPLTKIVVGIYPSPLSDEHVGASLKAYGSLETQDQVDTVDAADDRFMDVRQSRVQLFNDALRERCEHHNREADADPNSDANARARLEYHDVQDQVLTPADEEGMVEVKEAYKDVSDLNIHLIHETTLQLWVEKWPWYKELTLASDRDHSTTTNFLEYLQKTFDDYRKTKPWAERTHVAETMGVQLSAA